MNSQVILPETTRSAIEAVALQARHPLVQLDKLSAAGEQTDQKRSLDRVCQSCRDEPLQQQLRQRREILFTDVGAERFSATTTAPLTLHLARASALENAGICLHPIYGFAYLPASGLKGMARAFAETVWLPTQLGSDWAAASDACWNEPLDLLDAVFGFAPYVKPKKEERERMSPFARSERSPQGSSPASPQRWQTDGRHGQRRLPRRLAYTMAETDRGHRQLPPPELLRRFGERHRASARRLGESASGLLPGGTACRTREEFSCTLELITPAFLAGAEHEDDTGREGCDLRSATLRGLLRWWWRTLHASHVDTPTLRRMEAAVWGNTEASGAVRISVKPVPDSPHSVELFSKQSYESVGRNEKTGPYGIPDPPGLSPNKITPGLGYVAFGMDDMVKEPDGSKHPRQRFVMLPGRRWTLQLSTRPLILPSGKDTTRLIGADLLLEQAKAALWLFTTYGGVGSKSRNGFGSLDASDWSRYSLAMCEAAAVQFRREFLEAARSTRNGDPTSALHRRATNDVVADFVGWVDVWALLEQVGFAVQSFQKTRPHEMVRCALGLPKVFRGGYRGSFDPTEPFRAVYLQADTRSGKHWEKARFASPWHIHVDRIDGGHRVRVTAFVQPALPDEATSGRMLRDFLEFLDRDLKRRARLEPRTMTPRRQESGFTQRTPRQTSRPAPIAGPTLTREQIKERLEHTSQPQVLLKALGKGDERSQQCQRLKLAPKIPAGFRTEGGWKLIGAPQVFAEGTIVLGEADSRTGRFVEVLGALQTPPGQQQTRQRPTGPRR